MVTGGASYDGLGLAGADEEPPAALHPAATASNALVATVRTALLNRMSTPPSKLTISKYDGCRGPDAHRGAELCPES
ncbi:hypothetical protein GCM10010167_84140 [Paractinoplanes deccanensis]